MDHKLTDRQGRLLRTNLGERAVQNWLGNYSLSFWVTMIFFVKYFVTFQMWFIFCIDNGMNFFATFSSTAGKDFNIQFQVTVMDMSLLKLIVLVVTVTCVISQPHKEARTGLYTAFFKCISFSLWWISVKWTDPGQSHQNFCQVC